MSEERPEYCPKCGAPEVWCDCQHTEAEQLDATWRLHARKYESRIAALEADRDRYIAALISAGIMPPLAPVEAKNENTR